MTDLSLPLLSVDYNFYMGGVDIANQYRSYASTQIIAYRTWYPLFFWLLDCATINSFLVSRDIFQETDNPVLTNHRRFRIRLAWNLVTLGAALVHNSSCVSYSTINLHRNQPTGSIARSSGYVTSTWEPAPPRGRRLQHCLATIANNKRRSCKLCLVEKKLGKRTWVVYTNKECITCNLVLCKSHFRSRYQHMQQQVEKIVKKYQIYRYRWRFRQQLQQWIPTPIESTVWLQPISVYHRQTRPVPISTTPVCIAGYYTKTTD